MVSDELLKESFRFHKEYRNCDIEYTESWKNKISHAIEYRCKDPGITEDDIIYQLFEDEVMEEYRYLIQNESLKRLAKFYGIEWEPLK